MDEKELKKCHSSVLMNLHYLCEVVQKKTRKYKFLLEENKHGSCDELGNKIINLIMLIERNCNAFKQCIKKSNKQDELDTRDVFKREPSEQRIDVNPEHEQTSSMDFRRVLSRTPKKKKKDLYQTQSKEVFHEANYDLGLEFQQVELSDRRKENIQEGNSELLDRDGKNQDENIQEHSLISGNNKSCDILPHQIKEEVLEEIKEEVLEEVKEEVLENVEGIENPEKRGDSQSCEQNELDQIRDEIDVKQTVLCNNRNEAISTDELLEQLNEVIDTPSPQLCSESIVIKPEERASNSFVEIDSQKTEIYSQELENEDNPCYQGYGAGQNKAELEVVDKKNSNQNDGNNLFQQIWEDNTMDDLSDLLPPLSQDILRNSYTEQDAADALREIEAETSYVSSRSGHNSDDDSSSELSDMGLNDSGNGEKDLVSARPMDADVFHNNRYDIRNCSVIAEKIDISSKENERDSNNDTETDTDDEVTRLCQLDSLETKLRNKKLYQEVESKLRKVDAVASVANEKEEIEFHQTVDSMGEDSCVESELGTSDGNEYLSNIVSDSVKDNYDEGDINQEGEDGNEGGKRENKLKKSSRRSNCFGSTDILKNHWKSDPLLTSKITIDNDVTDKTPSADRSYSKHSKSKEGRECFDETNCYDSSSNDASDKEDESKQGEDKDEMIGRSKIVEGLRDEKSDKRNSSEEIEKEQRKPERYTDEKNLVEEEDKRLNVEIEQKQSEPDFSSKESVNKNIIEMAAEVVSENPHFHSEQTIMDGEEYLARIVSESIKDDWSVNDSDQITEKGVENKLKNKQKSNAKNKSTGNNMIKYNWRRDPLLTSKITVGRKHNGSSRKKTRSSASYPRKKSIVIYRKKRREIDDESENESIMSDTIELSEKQDFGGKDEELVSQNLHQEEEETNGATEAVYIKKEIIWPDMIDLLSEEGDLEEKDEELESQPLEQTGGDGNEVTEANICKGTDIENPSETKANQTDEKLDSENPKKGRRDIRPLLTYEELAEATKQAEEEEVQRSFRIERRHRLLNSQLSEEDELILDTTKEGEKVAVDPELSRKLYPHQREGVSFMWEACFESVERLQESKGSGCILAHCMGLGKTLQVVTLVHTLFCHPITNTKHVLVICPVSTVFSWVKEIKSGLETAEKEIDIYVEYIEGIDSLIAKCIKIKRWRNHSGILIMGYEAFVHLIFGKTYTEDIKKELWEALLDPGPDLIVCDEGHLLKNGKSRRTQALSKIKTSRRIVLTGTPMQNNLKEYYYMVNYVNPNILGTFKEYSNRFVIPISNGQYGDSTEADIMVMKKRSHVLHKLLRNTVQRYEVGELHKYLKPIKNYTIFIQLHPIQESLYKHYIQRAKERFLEIKNYLQKAKENPFPVKKNRGTNLFTDMYVTKYICSHPYLLSILDKEIEIKRNKKDPSMNAEDDVLKFELIEKDWWKEMCPEHDLLNIDCGPKLKLALAIIEEAEKIGEKVLIFTSNLIELNSLEFFLKRIGTKNSGSWHHGRDYFRMDGSVAPRKRARMCYLFNNPANRQLRVFLISYRVGGIGLTLTAANRVIILGSMFNPVYDTQSIYRCYRFGQTRTVYVYRLISMGTMEEKIYRKCVSKLALACRVVDMHQIDRHYAMAEIEQLYENNIDLTLPRPALAKPDDDLLAALILKFDFIYKYLDHQGLLENRPEHDLNDEDKERAWEEFKKECEKQTAVPLLFSKNDLNIMDIELRNSKIETLANYSVPHASYSNPVQLLPIAGPSHQNDPPNAHDQAILDNVKSSSGSNVGENFIQLVNMIRQNTPKQTCSDIVKSSNKKKIDVGRAAEQILHSLENSTPVIVQDIINSKKNSHRQSKNVAKVITNRRIEYKSANNLPIVKTTYSHLPSHQNVQRMIGENKMIEKLTNSDTGGEINKPHTSGNQHPKEYNSLPQPPTQITHPSSSSKMMQPTDNDKYYGVNMNQPPKLVQLETENVQKIYAMMRKANCSVGNIVTPVQDKQRTLGHSKELQARTNNTNFCNSYSLTSDDVGMNSKQNFEKNIGLAIDNNNAVKAILQLSTSKYEKQAKILSKEQDDTINISQNKNLVLESKFSTATKKALQNQTKKALKQMHSLNRPQTVPLDQISSLEKSNVNQDNATLKKPVGKYEKINIGSGNNAESLIVKKSEVPSLSSGNDVNASGSKVSQKTMPTPQNLNDITSRKELNRRRSIASDNLAELDESTEKSSINLGKSVNRDANKDISKLGNDTILTFNKFIENRKIRNIEECAQKTNFSTMSTEKNDCVRNLQSNNSTNIGMFIKNENKSRGSFKQSTSKSGKNAKLPIENQVDASKTSHNIMTTEPKISSEHLKSKYSSKSIQNSTPHLRLSETRNSVNQMQTLGKSQKEQPLHHSSSSKSTKNENSAITKNILGSVDLKKPSDSKDNSSSKDLNPSGSQFPQRRPSVPYNCGDTNPRKELKRRHSIAFDCIGENIQTSPIDLSQKVQNNVKEKISNMGNSRKYFFIPKSNTVIGNNSKNSNIHRPKSINNKQNEHVVRFMNKSTHEEYNSAKSYNQNTGETQGRSNKLVFLNSHNQFTAGGSNIKKQKSAVPSTSSSIANSPAASLAPLRHLVPGDIPKRHWQLVGLGNPNIPKRGNRQALKSSSTKFLTPPSLQSKSK